MIIHGVLVMGEPAEASVGKFVSNNSFTVQQLAGGRCFEDWITLNLFNALSTVILL